ncbi:MAG: TonB system transport protein ExbD [Beijerinckiaceae bacterium]|nr:TonB system transport protein ExbD [Beijerinckiaceae bacterium]
MAGGINQGGGFGADDLAENSEINVTPFIDVILVLLIIFMVAAPLSTVDAPVELPVSTAKPQPRPDKPVFLTLKADLSILIGDQPLSVEQLASALDVQTKLDREQRIFVRADQAVSYGEVVRLMNALRAAGYLKIALVGLEGGASSPAEAAPKPAAP